MRKQKESHYFVLLSISAPKKEHAQLLPQLSAVCSEPAKLIWQEKSTIAFGAVSSLPAHKLYSHLIKGISGVDNLLILEAGVDWCTFSETVLAGWLNSHLGAPRAY